MAWAFRERLRSSAIGTKGHEGPGRKDKTQRALDAPAALRARRLAGPCTAYLTSFQNAAFRRQAITVNRARYSNTHTPRRTRVVCAGSPIHCR